MTHRWNFSFNLRILVLSVFCLCVFSTGTFADEQKPRFGRLPDGRAYRIDQAGYQLIDQMAELEVALDDLRKQVTALENESALKQQQIDDLLASGRTPRERKLKESDLAQQKFQSPERPAENLPPSIACSSYTSPLEGKIAALQEKLATAKPTASANCDEVVKTTADELEQSKKMLEQRSRREQELNDELASLSNEVTSLRGSLAAMQNEKNIQIAAVSPVLDSRRAKFMNDAPPTTTEDIAEVKEPAQPSLEENTPENLALARREFKTALQDIQGLVMKRKDLLDSLKNSHKGVTLSLQPLKTANGESLDTLRVRVSKLDSTSDLAALRTGLQQITSILRDDINTANRLIAKR